MSTFNPPADIAQITLAKSSDVNAVKSATAIAFSLLPSEVKLQRGTVNFSVDTGTVNSYVVTLDASITTYTDGLQVVFRPLNSNTGTASINLNGLGAKSIRLTDSNPISAGDISAGAVIDVRYSTATGFFHLTPNSAIYAHDAGVSAHAAAVSQSAAATSASNAAASATSAAGSASSASTSANNAATSASSMTASVASCTASQSAAATSATNAATSASGASASATNAASSATTATTQASNASTSATNAAASATTASTQATNAATSASTATTQATAAGTSATNAAASATAASGSASTASTQAGIATTQAGLATTNGAAQVALATTQATNAATSASTATTQATNASTSATNAANYAAALIATSTTSTAIATGAKTFTTQASKQFNAGQFVIISSNADPANYMFAQVTSYSTTSLVVNVLAIGGSGTLTDWNISVSGAQGAQGAKGDAGSAGGTKTISNQTAAYTVVAGDLGKIINCTSGTFSVNLTDAATLGSGFTCTIWNTGTGAITIDPSGAETIDGVATLILRRGEGTDVVCDGTNWETSYKKTMRGYTENYLSTATRPVATTGNNVIAIGNSYASGTDSFAAAIANNTSTYGAQNQGAIAMGGSCLANGFHSKAIGNTASATGAYSVALGSNITASGYGAFAIGGSSSGITASGQSAFALGDGSSSTKFGKYAYSGGLFAALGDAQYGQIVLRAATTTTTAVVLTSNAGAAGTTNQLILASGQAMAISGTLIAKQSASGNMAGWTITGIVSNNAGTMAVSGLALTAIGSDSITLGAQPTIAVDNTNKGVTITSGFKAATSIRWVANVQTSEVSYA